MDAVRLTRGVLLDLVDVVTLRIADFPSALHHDRTGRAEIGKLKPEADRMLPQANLNESRSVKAREIEIRWDTVQCNISE
jgi:hypothetical protein